MKYLPFIAAILALAAPSEALAQSKYFETQRKDSKQFGSGPAQKIGFHGAAPIAQRANEDQEALDDTPLSQLSDDFDETDINPVVDQVNALTVLVNELRAALVEKGLIRGEAVPDPEPEPSPTPPE